MYKVLRSRKEKEKKKLTISGAISLAKPTYFGISWSFLLSDKDYKKHEKGEQKKHSNVQKYNIEPRNIITVKHNPLTQPTYWGKHLRLRGNPPSA